MKNWLDVSQEELTAWFAERKQPAYRAKQIHKWIFQKRAVDFDEMTDLPQSLRAELKESFTVLTGKVVKKSGAPDEAEKLLIEFADGHRIECVLLRDDRHHRTMCLSSQVGCAMRCAFCATGIDGVERNLTRGEIVEQMLHLQRLLPSEERMSNIVMMGMGEPLLNVDAVMGALAEATSADGLGIGVRRITISTVGLPKGVLRLAELDCPYHLAVSLHAPNDELRNQLVPVNRGVGIQKVLAAADAYFEKTGRRVTYEYVLLAGVNDQPEHARQLVQILRGRPSLVNLIPFNPVSGLSFRTPAPSATAEFAEILNSGGLTTAIRYRKGDRIDAACGQLRRKQSQQD